MAKPNTAPKHRALPPHWQFVVKHHQSQLITHSLISDTVPRNNSYAPTTYNITSITKHPAPNIPLTHSWEGGI